MFNYKNQFNLEDRIAFVFGGLGLIGQEVSTAIAQAGAKTIILDIKNDNSSFIGELNKSKYDISYKKFDCSDTKNLEKNYSQLIKEFGCQDIFINCSYPRTDDWPTNSFSKIKLESFQKNIELQMIAYSWLSKLAAEESVKNNKNGSIIHLGSIYGLVGQDLSIYRGTNMSENMTYSIIKGGITNFTRQMAAYYGRYNIRVNTICPGAIEGHVAGKDKKQSALFIKNFSEKAPLKRLGKSSEIGSSAVFLASDASSYITGLNLIVDGGWTII
tara:strand:- start:75 stop:890 length:816 start_codon:yes stop_codon:yes gene_type:complete